MKFGICQELFEGWTWERQCEFIAEVGYDGVEIAPFTLGGDPTALSTADRDTLRATAERFGLEIIGLHWLLAKTEGFHLTTSDEAVRQKTADYFDRLANLCADLGGRVMVLGSPHQRNVEEGMLEAKAFEHAKEVIEIFLPTMERRNVVLCLEPLGSNETNFMTSCAEARQLIDHFQSPSVRLHQDVKAMLYESIAMPKLIEQHADVTSHFHANDKNLRGPGMGDVDFVPVFKALQETGYDGYVSVEVFDYAMGAEETAQQSLIYMRDVLSRIDAR